MDEGWVDADGFWVFEEGTIVTGWRASLKQGAPDA